MKQQNNNPIWGIFKFVFIIACFASFQASFFWGLKYVYVAAVLFLFCLLVRFTCPYLFGFNGRNTLWFLVLLTACALTGVHRNLNGKIDVVLSILPLYYLMNLKWDYKKNLFDSFRKWLGVFLLISLVYYLLYFIGLPLPHYTSSPGAESRDYDNYILFVVLPNAEYRFFSVFLEPGYLGCLMALLLFAGDYKLDKKHWYNRIFALSLFFTLSLAGWGLTLLGWFLDYLKKNKMKTYAKIGLLAVLLAVTVAGVSYFKDYNGGNNIINESILQRLEYDEDRGTIAGDNRTSEANLIYFYFSFLNSNNIWFGVDNPDDVIEGSYADWTSFVICYGFVGLAGFVLFLIVSVFIDKRNRYQRFILVLLYALMFFQTVYGIYWLIYISVFVIGLSFLSEQTSQNAINKSDYAVRVSSK